MAGQTVTPMHECMLQRLVGILLDVVSKKPSNLNFGVGCSICLDEVRILSSPGNALSDVDCVFRFVVLGRTFDV